MKHPERVRLDDRIFEDEATHSALLDWVAQHGIDPDDVTVPGWVERRPEAMQVAYVGFVPDEDGHPKIDYDRDAVWRRAVVVQLDRTPEPFPELSTVVEGDR